MLLSYWLFVISLVFLCLLSLASVFVGVGRIAPNEERLVLSKQAVQFSFTYSASRDLLYNCLSLITLCKGRFIKTENKIVKNQINFTIKKSFYFKVPSLRRYEVVPLFNLLFKTSRIFQETASKNSTLLN